MNIRENWEKYEIENLSKFASKVIYSKGREVYEEPCIVRTDYQRDRDRIVHAKAFRRLMHKTQVFISPGDHYRTRLTHTLEVAQISKTIARALRLNEDLTEAIALGHDLGHTPFGHTGESVIGKFLDKKKNNVFKHNIQSLRVVDKLEKGGKGLNLTYEVRDGIRNHSGNDIPSTLEGQIVRTADRIAYLNHDVEDAVRGNVIKDIDIPKEVRKMFGNTSSERINFMVIDMINASKGKFEIMQTKEVKKTMNIFREFMFEKVYINSVAKEEDDKVERLILGLLEYYKSNSKALYNEYVPCDDDHIRNIVDYISGMTDGYAVSTFKKIFLPQGYNKK